MGILFLEYVTAKRVFVCSTCASHLASSDEIISKAFHGSHGRAFLFNNVVNVTQGDEEERVMTTGLHTVTDIFCKKCETVLGWRYKTAYETSQKYKEGKFILETTLISELVSTAAAAAAAASDDK